MSTDRHQTLEQYLQVRDTTSRQRDENSTLISIGTANTIFFPFIIEKRQIPVNQRFYERSLVRNSEKGARIIEGERDRESERLKKPTKNKTGIKRALRGENGGYGSQRTTRKRKRNQTKRLKPKTQRCIVISMVLLFLKTEYSHSSDYLSLACLLKIDC